jgi:hypothetical protein
MSSALRPTTHLEDQVSVFTFPSDRVAQLYPQVRGSLFVAFHYSQGYGGGILTRLHMGTYYPYFMILCCILMTENQHTLFCVYICNYMICD